MDPELEIVWIFYGVVVEAEQLFGGGVVFCDFGQNALGATLPVQKAFDKILDELTLENLNLQFLKCVIWLGCALSIEPARFQY